MATRKNYGSSAEIQNFLIENVAPNYFDFDEVNNYRSGIFGYINEIMAVITMDAHSAINIARREFYPVSAENPRSLNKMAALQGIDMPLVTPGQAKAVLILDRDEVIENSTYSNGVYSCTIDNTVSILANNIPFSLLYPIVILSSRSNGEWTHTTHYDKSTTNSLDTSTGGSNYIVNRTVNSDGKQWLILSVTLYQCERDDVSKMVPADNNVETISLQFKFDGDLANFEVFYIEEPGQSEPVQLIKLMDGSQILQYPFCCYKLLTEDSIELTFPRNIYFTPKMNSEIRVVFYTSLGSDGEFPSYKGELSCDMNSEDFPYNNNMTMLGIIQGSCAGATDAPTQEEYKQEIMAAYSTNNTITTENDMQILFNEKSDAYSKIVFRKRRQDAFNRLYGAYILLKDEDENVIPTNTMTLKIRIDEFSGYNSATTKGTIKPGTLFEYDPKTDTADIYTGKAVNDLVITDDLSPYDDSSERFIYTNPFLIIGTLNPDLIGYYINTISAIHTVDYTYMNDDSMIQFMGNNMRFERNAINGNDFYKISIQISPTQDLDPKEIITEPEEDAPDSIIRADQDGTVKSIFYSEELKTPVATIVYQDGSTQNIQVGSFVDKVTLEEGTEDTTDDGWIYHTGYRMTVGVHESFLAGDIIARKKVTDLGRIRACLDIKDLLYDNGMYSPMVIESYDKANNIYTMVGYISVEDLIDNNDHILVRHGLHMASGAENDNVSMPYSGLTCSVSVFYKYTATNLPHKYSNFDYLHQHTMTNTYQDNDENGFNMITLVQFVRSSLDFEKPEDKEIVIDPLAEESFPRSVTIVLREVPLVKANWVKQEDNYSYLINKIENNYDILKEMFYSLENNFTFDMKFYNTYGKSKFFKVGILNKYKPLTRVNCTFRFGIRLSSLTNQEMFLEKFRPFVKNQIESINSGASWLQQSIYILSLTSVIKQEFSEIGHLEYYGFNEYDESVQKIEPVPQSDMTDELLANYVPEFINIPGVIEAGETVPAIEVTFLDTEE